MPSAPRRLTKIANIVQPNRADASSLRSILDIFEQIACQTKNRLAMLVADIV